jgi:methanogenic corrinoid protein MtbC1
MVKVMVGGAPIIEKYAVQIGADGYAQDAAAQQFALSN